MFIGYEIIFVCSFFFLLQISFIWVVYESTSISKETKPLRGMFVQWFSFKVWIWKLFVLLFFNLQSEAVGMKVGYVENRTIVRVLIVMRLCHFNEQKCSEQIFFENIVNSISVWILNNILYLECFFKPNIGVLSKSSLFGQFSPISRRDNLILVCSYAIQWRRW